ncbi:MAG TPA: hypothetical protein VF590_08650, partial [Isosphaeraceae bacterium]
FGRGGPGFVYRIEVEPLGRRVAVTADLGARTLPRGGGLAIPLTVERRGFDGAVTVLAGVLPPGISAAPTTVPAKAQKGVLVLTAAADAPLGPFPLTLAVRDVPGSVEVAFLERGRDLPMPVESGAAPLAVAEPTPLGVALEPRELTVAPGGQAEVQVTLERRGESARKGVKLRLLAGDGALDGFEPVKEVTLAANATSSTWTLKAKPDAAPRRVALTVRAWFDGAPDGLGVDAEPATLVVPEHPGGP